MDRLFLDANIHFCAAYRDDAPLRRFWALAGVELLTSAYAVAEAKRHLDEEQRQRLVALLDGVRVVADAPRGALPRGVELRAKDAPILATAIAAKATHLITGDRRDFGAHFGKRLAGVLILPPRDYWRALPRT